MNLEKELSTSLELMDMGIDAELHRGDDGTVSVRPRQARLGATGFDLQPPIRQEMSQAEPQAPGQAMEELPAVVGGLAAGATSATVGLPGDIAALAAGAYNAIFPEGDEGRLEAFTSTLTEISDKYGSGAVKGFIQQQAEEAGLSDVQMQALDEAMMVGEFGGIGGVAKAAVTKGPQMLSKVGDAIEGAGDAAKVRMADADGSFTVGMGVDPDPAIAAAGDAVKAMRGGVEDKIISQRLPTAVSSTEDPIATKLVTDTATTLQQPEAKIKANFEKISQYPNMPDNLVDMPPEQAASTLKEHIVSNLLFLHDRVPEATRQRSKQWYVGANKISQDYADKYNLPLESVAGAMAALSPQKDWYQNADLGRRVIETIQSVTKGNERGMTMSGEMRVMMNEKFKANKPKDKVIMDAIDGKTYEQLELPAEKAMWLRVYDETYNDRSFPIVNPEGTFGDTVKTGKGVNRMVAWGSLSEIAKAINAIESGGDLKIISDQMGGQNKVRNFYNNIYNPASTNGDVTIDTHAVAAGMLRPLAGDATEVHHNFGSAPDAKKRDARWNGGMSNSSLTGTKGIYGIYADAYREAAQQRGVLPREMQSITWEAVRGLFPDTMKRDKKYVEDITNIWYEYKKGNKTLEEAQNATEQRAGGIDKPTWED